MSWQALAGTPRAGLLPRIADNLLAEGTAIAERANFKTGLPLPRLQSERKRTTGQLNLFADALYEGSWVDARIDEADRERKPVPTSRYSFNASSSWTGCGVRRQQLPAGILRPGASELVGTLIQKAVKDSDFPLGMFSLLFDVGTNVGVALVQHPAIKAVAFTGSASGGQALMRLAAERPEPIPCYAEMGSTNPLFILSGAMRERGAQIAQGLQDSFAVGSGQFCTKPGIVFIPEDQSAEFERTLGRNMGGLGPFIMLTHRIAAKYKEAIDLRLERSQAELIMGKRDPEESQHVSKTEQIDPNFRNQSRANCFNGFPTGVEVSHAMVHGGPFPATSDGRSTSVGTLAILRFVRPVCLSRLS